MLPRHIVDSLTLTAELCLSSVKDEAAVLVAHFAERHKDSALKMSQRAGLAFVKASPFLHSAAYLSTPGAYLRVKNIVMTAETWLPIYQEFTAVYSILSGRGWSKEKILSFMERSAKKTGSTPAVVTLRPLPPRPFPS